jgi:hypothetical protein
MNRSIVALLLAFPLVTFAATAGAEEGKSKHNFPMSAVDFQSRQDARVVKMRAKLEERIMSKKLDAEAAKAKRAKFEARIAAVQGAIDKAKADGTVTKDEAKAVREVAHAGRKGHHRKGHGQNDKDGKKEEPKK